MVNMSILDNDEVNVAEMQCEIDRLRQEKENLEQHLKDYRDYVHTLESDIDEAYLLMYKDYDGMNNRHLKLRKMIGTMTKKRWNFFKRFL